MLGKQKCFFGKLTGRRKNKISHVWREDPGVRKICERSSWEFVINCTKPDKSSNALCSVTQRVDILTRKYTMEAKISTGIAKYLENIVRGKRSSKLLCGNEVREIRLVGREVGIRAAVRNLQPSYTRTISIKHDTGY